MGLEWYRYEVRLKPLTDDEGRGWLAEVPALSGCISDGETPFEAATNAQEAIAAWIETARKLGRAVPDETT